MSTRQDTPRMVDASPEGIQRALQDREADLRRLGLGIQADGLRAILHAHRAFVRKCERMGMIR